MQNSTEAVNQPTYNQIINEMSQSSNSGSQQIVERTKYSGNTLTNINSITQHQSQRTKNQRQITESYVQMKKIDFIPPKNHVTKRPSQIKLPKQGSKQEDIEEIKFLKTRVKQHSNSLQIMENNYHVQDYEIPDHTMGKNLTYSQVLKKQIMKGQHDQEMKQKMINQIQKQRGYMSNDQRSPPVRTQKKIPTRQPKMNLQQQMLSPFKPINFNYDFFSGKLSIVWLFIIRRIDQSLLQKIQSIYKSITDRDFQIPLCQNFKQAQPYLKTNGSIFKIIVDLDNGLELTSHKQYEKKILSIYIYNNDRTRGINRAAQIKAGSKKVRGAYTDLTPLLKRAQNEVDNGNKFMKQEQGNIQEIKYQSKLPTFIKLSQQDKSQITKYRTNLYGAIKLTDQFQRRLKLQNFSELVKKVYDNNSDQLQNLINYLKIQHIRVNDEDKEKTFFQILRFYVQQTFYYKLTNNLLRISRTVEEFKPCTIPFNQNYRAIKHYYNKSIELLNNHVPSYTLYRGAPVNQKDLKMLQKGNFIELLGFVSTSKNQQYVKDNFLKRKGDYLFVFEISGRPKNQKLFEYDHGFVDLSQFNIATTQFEAEQQVLLNALNIYRVKSIITEEESQDGVGQVRLQYGSIFQLYEKDQDSLTKAERGVLDNFRYCAKLQHQIEDHGDVLRQAQQYDKSRDFYKEQVKKEQNMKNFNKLAEAHYNCGQTDEARQNALKSMAKYQLQMEKFKNADRQTCMKIFQIHDKNTKILKQRQDSHNARRGIDFQIALLTDQDWYIKAQKYRERGQLNLKQGNIIQSEKDLKISEQIILDKVNSFNEMKKKVEWKFFLKYLTGCCCFSNSVQIQLSKQQQLDQIDQLQKQVTKLKGKINELLLKINFSMQQVSEYVGNKTDYEECVRKGRMYFQQLQTQAEERTEDPFMDARIKVVEAKIQNSFNMEVNIAKSYDLMQEAIGIISEIQPMNPKVGQYSTILGLFKQKQFNRTYLIPNEKYQNLHSQKRSGKKAKVMPLNQDQDDQQEKFDYALHQQTYTNCKSNFQKAIEVATYNQNQDHPSVLEVRNYLGDLSFQYSKLKQGHDQATTVLSCQRGNEHSQGAKSALLLAKISLSRGQIKNGFKMIQKATTILKKALVKQQSNIIYLKIFQSSPIYIDIQLWKCKTFNRQMKHDLALHTIQNLQRIAKQKLKDVNGVGFLADIYEEYGNTLVYMGQNISFETTYLKAIKLRQNQMGKYNIPNAISLCTLFKYLLFIQDKDTAQDYLLQSNEIFSQFASDHPNIWVQLASSALFSEKTEEKKDQLRFMERSINLLEKRYSKNHINFMKLKVKYAQVLSKNDLFPEAIKQFEQVSEQVNGDLMVSRREQVIESIVDDEKVGVQEYLQVSIKKTQTQYLRKSAMSNLPISDNNINQQNSQVLLQQKIKKNSLNLPKNNNRMPRQSINSFEIPSNIDLSRRDLQRQH